MQQDNSVKLQVRLNDNVYLSFEEKDLGVIKYWQESYKGHLSSNWIEGTLEGMEVVIKQPKQPKVIDLKMTINILKLKKKETRILKSEKMIVDIK